MNDQRPPDHDDQEIGPPVAELRELLAAPPSGFMARVRGSIHRRLFAGDTADFIFQAFFATILEYIDIFVKTLAGASPSPPTAPPSAKEHD